jgi:hypothetical protein
VPSKELTVFVRLYVFARWVDRHRMERQRRTPKHATRCLDRLSDHAWAEYAEHVPPADPTWRIEDHINASVLLLPEGLCQHQRNSLGLRRLRGDLDSNYVAPCPCARATPNKSAESRAEAARRLPLSAWAEFNGEG